MEFYLFPAQAHILFSGYGVSTNAGFSVGPILLIILSIVLIISSFIKGSRTTKKETVGKPIPYSKSVLILGISSLSLYPLIIIIFYGGAFYAWIIPSLISILVGVIGILYFRKGIGRYRIDKTKYKKPHLLNAGLAISTIATILYCYLLVKDLKEAYFMHKEKIREENLDAFRTANSYFTGNWVFANSDSNVVFKFQINLWDATYGYSDNDHIIHIRYTNFTNSSNEFLGGQTFQFDTTVKNDSNLALPFKLNKYFELSSFTGELLNIKLLDKNNQYQSFSCSHNYNSINDLVQTKIKKRQQEQIRKNILLQGQPLINICQVADTSFKDSVTFVKDVYNKLNITKEVWSKICFNYTKNARKLNFVTGICVSKMNAGYRLSTAIGNLEDNVDFDAEGNFLGENQIVTND